MELKLFILAVACFSCLIPSSVSFHLLAAKAVASQAVQDLAAIKADTINAKKSAVLKAFSDIADIATNGLALKGQAIKKAAISIAGSLLNGAASIGSTLAHAGINMVASQFGHFGTVKPKPDCVVKPFQPVQFLPDVTVNRPDNIIPSLHPPVSSHVRHPMIFPPVVPERHIYKKPANRYNFFRPSGSRFAIMDMPRFDGPAFEAIQYGKRR